MKKSVLGKLLISAVTIPLWFLNILPDIGHLPNHAGEIVEVTFRHSMFENVSRAMHPALAYAALALAAISLVTNAAALMFPKSKKWQTVGNIAFWAAIASFALLLLLASHVTYNY